MKVRVGKNRIKKEKVWMKKKVVKKEGEFFSFPIVFPEEILGTFFTAPPFFLSFPLFLSFSFFFFPCPSFFFLMIDIGPAILSFNQKNAPAGISLRIHMERRKKILEGGREGRPFGPHISSSLNPTLQNLPSPYSPFGKIPLAP
jgi:hypothetical protein